MVGTLALGKPFLLINVLQDFSRVGFGKEVDFSLLPAELLFRWRYQIIDWCGRPEINGLGYGPENTSGELMA